MSGSEPRKWLARLPAPRTVLRALGVVALVMVELLLALDWQHVERPLAASVALIPLIIVAGFVTLSQRDRHPVGVFAIVMILSASAAVVPLYHPIIVPLAALYAVATRRPARTALLALLTTILMFAVIAVCYPVPDLPPGTRWVSAVGYALIAVITWAAGRLFGSQARKLTDMTTQRAAAIEAAVAAERLRLARELHDIVSHSVSIMVVQAGGARRMISRDPQRAEQAMYAVEDLGREAMDELRRLLTVLRSASGESAPDAQDAPGLDALPSLISKTTDAGIPTMLEIEGEEGSLAPSVGLTAYRVVQEALTNAVKHAGQGATARVRLHWTTIGDDAARRGCRCGSAMNTHPTGTRRPRHRQSCPSGSAWPAWPSASRPSEVRSPHTARRPDSW